MYVRSVLKESELTSKGEKEKVAPVFQVNVTLKAFVGQGTSTYTVQMKNTDTVVDLLQEVRDLYGLVYEKIDYARGVEISEVKGVPAQQNYKWAVLSNNADITNEIGNTNLVEGAVYELKLMKK